MKNVSRVVLLCFIATGLLSRVDCLAMANEPDVAATLDEFAKAWPESRIPFTLLHGFPSSKKSS